MRNPYIPDWSEQETPEDYEELCDCGCRAKAGHCTVDDEVDEALLEKE